jgi:xylulokinase
MASYILAHDLGTTGDKATLFSSEGNLISSAFTEYETFYPEIGWAEQNPDDYWKALCSSTKALIEKTKKSPGDIAVVTFSGQMMAALPVDDEGRSLRNSIIWADMRSTRQAREIAQRVEADRVYELTGHRLSASYSAAKIKWIRENEPEIYKKTYKFIHAKDYLVAKLTGRICSDYSDASGMNLLDITSLKWSAELLEAAGIDRNKLPDVFESTQVVGKVGREAASQSGLRQGTPVVLGGGDGACATCGAGVVSEGDAYIYLGTSTWMGLASEKPLVDPQKRTFTFWTKVDVYELLSQKAQKVRSGADGLLFLPYLMGERSPLWNPKARACFIGLSMLHSKAHMTRSVLEGVAYNMKIIELAFEEQGVKPEKIRMIGGGAKSQFWMRIFADVMEKPFIRLNFIEEATSVGAAIAGGVGAGFFSSINDAGGFVKIEKEVQPDRRNFLVYRRYYDIFKKSYEQLIGIFDIMDGLTRLQ